VHAPPQADIIERLPAIQVPSAEATRKMLDEKLAVPPTTPAERVEILRKVKGLAGKMGGAE
jgi:hypothetical protein